MLRWSDHGFRKPWTCACPPSPRWMLFLWRTLDFAQTEHNCTFPSLPSGWPTPDTTLNCAPKAVVTLWVSGYRMAALGLLGFLRGVSLRARAVWAPVSPPKPWGLNGRSLGSFLSCMGETCCFSYRSSEYNKAEGQISLSPLVSCQFPSQLWSHLDNKVLETSTYSSVCRWYLISHAATQLQGGPLWPSAPVLTSAPSPGSTHKPYKLQIVNFYIW